MKSHIWRILVVTALVTSSACAPTSAAELKVLTAGAFKQVVTALVPAYEKQTGNKVIIENDTAGGLKTKIQGGEAFDVAVITPAALKELTASGKIAAGTSANAGSPQNPDDSARAMRPSELGSKSFFSDIFSTFSDKGETGTFTGEPTRESLTAPPAGYQTPSPAQPYGLAPKQAKGKAATVEDRAAGTPR